MSQAGTTETDNATRRFIADLCASGAREQPIDCNSAFAGLGARFVSGAPGDVVLRFFAGPETVQGAGVVSGGTLASMLDCAIAVSVLSNLRSGQSCATASLTVNMLRAGLPGDFTERARVERIGARMAFAEARLSDPEDRLVATATSTLAVIPA